MDEKEKKKTSAKTSSKKSKKNTKTTEITTENEVLSDGEKNELAIVGVDNVSDERDVKESEEEEANTEDESWITEDEIMDEGKKEELEETLRKEIKRIGQSRFNKSLEKKKIEDEGGVYKGSQDESSEDSSYEKSESNESEDSLSHSSSHIEEEDPKDKERLTKKRKQEKENDEKDELVFPFEDKMEENIKEKEDKTEKEDPTSDLNKNLPISEDKKQESDSDDGITITRKNTDKNEKRNTRSSSKGKSKYEKKKKELEEEEEEEEELKIPSLYEYRIKGIGLKTIISPLLELNLKLLPTMDISVYELIEIVSIKVPRYITLSELRKVDKEIRYFDKPNIDVEMKHACQKKLLATERITHTTIHYWNQKIRDMFNGIFTLSENSFETCAWFLTRFDCNMKTIFKTEKEILDIINNPDNLSEFREFCKENQPKWIFWSRFNLRDEEKNILKASDIYHTYKFKNKVFNQIDYQEEKDFPWSIGLIEELEKYEDITVHPGIFRKRIIFKKILDDTEELLKLLDNVDVEYIQYEDDSIMKYQTYIRELKKKGSYSLIVSSEKRKKFIVPNLHPILYKNDDVNDNININNNNNTSNGDGKILNDLDLIIDRAHSFTYSTLISLLKEWQRHFPSFSPSSSGKEEDTLVKTNLKVQKLKMIGSLIIDIKGSPFKEIVNRNYDQKTVESDGISNMKLLKRDELNNFIKKSIEDIRIYYKDKSVLSHIPIKKENIQKVNYCSIWELKSKDILRYSIIYTEKMSKSDVYLCLQHANYLENTFICSSEDDFYITFGF